eukprot:s1283_g10.t1
MPLDPSGVIIPNIICNDRMHINVTVLRVLFARLGCSFSVIMGTVQPSSEVNSNPNALQRSRHQKLGRLRVAPLSSQFGLHTEESRIAPDFF